MIHYSSEVTIARPPHAVYNALLDPERFSQWTEMVDVTSDGGDPARVGARGSFRLADGPIKGTLSMEVTELAVDRRIVIHVTHPSLDWTSVSTLTPDGSGTRLVYAGDIRLLGWRRLLEPFAAGEVRAGEAAEAVRLKELLERGD